MNKLRVWWMPQIGIEKAFYIPVETVEEAKKVMDILAFYDCFEYNQDIKSDYCNCGGLQILNENNDWEDWYYEDGEHYFDDVDEYIEEMSSKTSELEKFTAELANQVTFD